MALDTLVTYAGIAVVFGAIKAKLKGQVTNLTGWVISICISIAVGIVTGYACDGFHLNQGVTFAFVAASALTAEGLATMIIGISDAAAEDPFGTIKKLRGK